jgi:hypothetical protein
LTARAFLQTIVVTATLFIVGCSTTSTIGLRSGAPIEATILGGNHDSIVVETRQGPRQIPRTEVTDIDQPGDTAMGIGAVVGAYGISQVRPEITECTNRINLACTRALLPIGVGATLLLWGATVHNQSLRAASEKTTQFVPYVMPTESGSPTAGIQGIF